MDAYIVKGHRGDFGLDRERPTLQAIMEPGDVLVLQEGDRMSGWQCISIEVEKVILQRFELGVPEPTIT